MKSAYIFGQENVTGRMFSIGKNMTVCRRVHTPEEVVDGFNRVTMEDMRGVADLVCDLNQYCGAAVTNGTFDMKQAMEG